MRRIALSVIFTATLCSVGYSQAPQKGTFGYDLEFLRKHKEVVVLKSESDNCQVAIVPDYQGRVMTSTADGSAGKGYGWINYDLISNGELAEHINVFGGEDRFWMGPEGGQYSIFFESGTDFTFDNWFTPAAIDTEPFELVEHDQNSASFLKRMKQINFSVYSFEIEVKRDISILKKSEVESNLNINLGPSVKYIGFQSVNNLKNTGSFHDLDRIAKKVLGVSLSEIDFATVINAPGEDDEQSKVLIPQQENKFTWVYKPAGDKFYGPDTKSLKEGEWYDQWVPNDHAFIKGDDGKWHIIGITHPYVDPDPKYGGIHQGEYASFHAVSSATEFKESLKESHFSDLPKILPPSDRPGEPLPNHAPFIVKRDGLFYMVYGPSPIRLAVSSDLSKWELKGDLFSQEGGSRDPNLLLHDGTYYMSYCSQRSVLTRTSKDLMNWSEPKTIFTTSSFDPESPSLIHQNGTFYLFVCSWNGVWDRKEIQGAYQHKTYVYQSDDLLDFGTGNEIATLNAHAPEIFQDEDGQLYISSVEWPNRGVSVDKLSWE